MSDQLEKCKFQLVIRIPFDAVDNLEARERAKTIMDGLCPGVNTLIKFKQDVSVKLQQVHSDRNPTGVSFIHETEGED